LLAQGPILGQLSPPAAEVMLKYVLQYATTNRPDIAAPDKVIIPELRTASGSLRYLVVVTEALAEASSNSLSYQSMARAAGNNAGPQHDAAARQNAILRLRALLGSAEQTHQMACERERLQTEILILRTHLPQSDLSSRATLESILDVRQRELRALGP